MGGWIDGWMVGRWVGGWWMGGMWLVIHIGHECVSKMMNPLSPQILIVKFIRLLSTIGSHQLLKNSTIGPQLCYVLI